MATAGENIREFLVREPFAPFRLVLTSGTCHDVVDPLKAAPLKSEVFVVLPDGEHWAHVPLLNIASIETIARNGQRKGRKRR